jgi:heterodisulfide reductase subunit B
MRYALFLGCTIPIRGQNYEMASREVAKVLGIEFVDIGEFSCCGFPVKSTDKENTLLMAARNLAIAKDLGLDICTLCNACTSILAEAEKELAGDGDLRDRVNVQLQKIGKRYEPGVKVKHFARILYEDVGVEKLEEKVTRDLSALSLSAHYGCHYLRPKGLYDIAEEPEHPESLDRLIEATGARAVDYKKKLECCGGAILGVDEDVALGMAKDKLDNVTANNVDALVTICPFCTIMYEDNQKKIETKYEVEYNLPVLYYPQVLGLAYGLDRKVLGFRLNKVKADALLEKIGVEL